MDVHARTKLRRAARISIQKFLCSAAHLFGSFGGSAQKKHGNASLMAGVSEKFIRPLPVSFPAAQQAIYPRRDRHELLPRGAGGGFDSFQAPGRPASTRFLPPGGRPRRVHPRHR
jgi:hypothetical protein